MSWRPLKPGGAVDTCLPSPSVLDKDGFNNEILPLQAGSTAGSPQAMEAMEAMPLGPLPGSVHTLL